MHFYPLELGYPFQPQGLQRLWPLIKLTSLTDKLIVVKFWEEIKHQFDNKIAFLDMPPLKVSEPLVDTLSYCACSLPLSWNFGLYFKFSKWGTASKNDLCWKWWRIFLFILLCCQSFMVLLHFASWEFGVEQSKTEIYFKKSPWILKDSQFIKRIKI